MIIQDFVPTSVDIFFGLTEFCCIPKFVVVISYISPGANTHFLAESDVGCQPMDVG